MIIGNGQTNQLDEKQTNFAIDATILYMIIGNELTNQLDEKQTNF